MVTCPNCQNVCDDSARFCPNCATPLGQQGDYRPPPQQQGQQAPPPPQGGYAQSPAPAPAPGGHVVQPAASAPFYGPVGQSASPGGPAQPFGAGGVPMGAPAAPSRSPIPAGFGFQPGAPPTPPAFAPTPPLLPKRRGPSPLRLLPFAIGPVIAMGALGFMFVGGGSCSSVEGAFESAGDPLGTFTFVPAQCRSGERMNVHGAILVGEGPTDGGIIVVQDPVNGPIVKVELPGSCQPPDYEVCTEVTIDKSECKVFKVKIRRTNTTVNDIRLMAGSLELDCQFKAGGTAKAKLAFDNCD